MGLYYEKPYIKIILYSWKNDSDTHKSFFKEIEVTEMTEEVVACVYWFIGLCTPINKPINKYNFCCHGLPVEMFLFNQKDKGEEDF